MLNTEKLTYELHSACIKGDLDSVKHYLHRGADIKKLEARIVGTLCTVGNLEILKYLVANTTIDLHVHKQIGLCAAIHSDKEHMIQYLLENGANKYEENVLIALVRSQNVQRIMQWLNDGLSYQDFDYYVNYSRKVGRPKELLEWWSDYKKVKNRHDNLVEEFDFFEKEELIKVNKETTKKMKI